MKSIFGLILLLLPLMNFGACTSIALAHENELIGGVEAPEGAYPEVIYVTSEGARCSATIVSPEGSKGVIMTAAHCVKDQGEIGPVSDIFVTVGLSKYKAKCRQAPIYRTKKEDHDIALCKVLVPFDIKPAVISKVGPKIGQKVRLMGYGCTSGDNGGSGGNDGILRIGKAKVIKLPKGKNHWFYTEDKSAACFGDSGAPSMFLEGEEEKHMVIGVTSRGDIQRLSLYTAVFTPESKKFLHAFAQDEAVDICGVTVDC